MKPKHRKLVERITAHTLLSTGQKRTLFLFLLVTLIGALVVPYITATVFVATALLFYACFTGLKVVIWFAAGRYVAPESQVVTVDDPDLPMYTVLIALYKEANMLPSLVDAIKELRYPKEKLQVLLLLEEDDNETVAEAIGLGLPDYFEVVLAPTPPKGISPRVHPRGKPRALNLGLERATGAHCVIYDAEDRPDPDQLLKAVAAFRSSDQNVACVQARLFFWNEETSWVTRFYWTEYVTHFEWVLAGLARLDLVPPLGGTSNHFRTQILRKIAIGPSALPQGAEGVGGWDPWNVTEDAELAGALAMRGYRVLMIDSTTREEATSTLRVADRQRRRWLKGYLQTGLVYTRQPLRRIGEMGFGKWFFYNLLMLGTPVSLLLNPIFWGMTVVYFITRSPDIERLFPPPLYYAGLLLMIAGNLLLFYQLVIACLKREGFGSIKYMLLTPVWWAFTSYSCYRMLFDLNKHVWHKTPHGHDLQLEQQKKSANQVPAVMAGSLS